MSDNKGHRMITWNSRSELPGILNERGLTGIGVEVGVERAHHACQLRKHWDGALLICVDKWEVNPNYAACDAARHNSSYTEAMANIARATKPIEVLREWSLDAAKVIKERNIQLDWIYLDGDHSYDAIKADIEAWLPLVRKGGIIAGHDFVSDGFHIPGEPLKAYPTKEASGDAMACPFGVTRAVTEAFPADKIALTSPDTDEGWRSWAVVVE